MSEICISTTPWVLQNYKNIQNLEFKAFRCLQENIKNEISKNQKDDSLENFITQIDETVAKFISFSDTKIRVELSVNKMAVKPLL
ncbi:hypothetical protein FFA43_09035 (plasmid) [Campylobacter hyointestinalis subsp. hyointestinalis]|uniref:hypothetical protein n=1 Tax=Campylobacter hyointestinalis TaxID=198 RepID=UPI000729FEED|nr:hypothetical protein [Campylobacter hyointestinalis]QCU00835.1 hypothetical protein FFA43_09035 [Campylobacter hyointestinalis subsp. hyointestinalis]TWO20029.1 hypothetical protein YZ80_06405 [Campylobacter hyointestinalis]CUU86685.1 Uncharacterised protein [Campylobacter hyointestinalis subsp. hyointestinalis]